MNITHKRIIKSCFIGSVIVICLRFLAGCSPDCISTVTYSPTGPSYDFNPAWEISGIGYDVLDRDTAQRAAAMVAEVDQCLAGVDWDEFDWSKNNLNTGAWCSHRHQRNELDCIRGIKIDYNWQYSCDGTVQLMSSQPAPQGICDWKAEQRGDDPLDPIECPCLHTKLVQGDWLIIVPPDLNMLKLVLVQYLTNCGNPYGNNQLMECVK